MIAPTVFWAVRGALCDGYLSVWHCRDKTLGTMTGSEPTKFLIQSFNEWQDKLDPAPTLLSKFLAAFQYNSWGVFLNEVFRNVFSAGCCCFGFIGMFSKNQNEG